VKQKHQLESDHRVVALRQLFILGLIPRRGWGKGSAACIGWFIPGNQYYWRMADEMSDTVAGQFTETLDQSDQYYLDSHTQR